MRRVATAILAGLLLYATAATPRADDAASLKAGLLLDLAGVPLMVGIVWLLAAMVAEQHPTIGGTIPR